EFPVFRAAYDFMCIQAMVGLFPYHLSRWWTDFQVDQDVATVAEPEKTRRPRRRRRKRSAD
ncbi:MAG TPA: polynucleotide adenylyltransferase PcnB, partial [Gammaproteobacteria bacterium]|nr:polynucleotide adenylyltransferase PcnB [Gammaproteobacteria bacterium]